VADDIDSLLESRASGKAADIDSMLASRASTPSRTRKITSRDSLDEALSFERQKAALRNPISDAIGDVFMNAVTGTGAAAASGLRGLYKLATGGGGDAAARAVEDTQGALTYQGDYEMAPWSPLNWPGQLIKGGSDLLFERTDSPLAATALETGGNAALMLLPGMARLRRPARAPEAPGGISPDAPPDLRIEEVAPRPAPTELPQAPVVQAAPEPLPARVPGDSTPLEIPARPAAAASPMKAEGVAREKPYTSLEGEIPKFEEVPTTVATGRVPEADQLSRAETLRKIGLQEARESALTGDAKAAATEYQTSKLDNAPGNYMRNVLDQEREALTNYSDTLVRESGGTVGTDQSALHARGNAIIQPLDSLREFFDSETSRLYKAADARAGNTPLETPKTREILADESEFLGTVEGESLLKGVRARMKSLGMVDAEGNYKPVTVKQAERFKQYLGDQWTPRTSRLIRRLKDSIDDDVMTGAGEDLYKQARASRALRGRTRDDPNGIAKLMDSDGPGGINRKVDIERIPDALAGMGVNQFKHVVETIRGMPEPLQPQAQTALQEIRAHFANKVAEAGHSTQSMWNAKAVTKYLNANRERMAQVFTPEEMANFKTLNDAGHILRKDQSYPGAAVQEHNLIKAGAMHALRGGGAALGGAIGGPVGAAVGGAIGEKAAGKFSERAALRGAQKRVVKLSDLLKDGEGE
jgi:hypothetical protein